MRTKLVIGTAESGQASDPGLTFRPRCDAKDSDKFRLRN